jgi:hypothetical protein
VDFYKAMFESAILTMPAEFLANGCHIQDWALADDSPARAVMDLVLADKRRVVSYAGLTWPGYIKNDGEIVHANVEAAIVSHLHAAVKSGALIIPGVKRRKSTLPAGMPDLKLCMIRGKCLPIKQSVHDVWDKVEDLQIRAAWKKLVENHNQTWSPNSTPWKTSKRPAVAVENAESLAEQTATILPTATQTLDDLKVLGLQFCLVVVKAPG